MPRADEMTVQGLSECLEWPLAHAAAFWTWAKASPKPDMQALVKATDRLLVVVNVCRIAPEWRRCGDIISTNI